MYSYEQQKPELLTDQGQRAFIGFRDAVLKLLQTSGAVRMQEAPSVGSDWRKLACLDRMVELGDIREIPQQNTPAQFRVFVAAK